MFAQPDWSSLCLFRLGAAAAKSHLSPIAPLHVAQQNACAPGQRWPWPWSTSNPYDCLFLCHQAQQALSQPQSENVRSPSNNVKKFSVDQIMLDDRYKSRLLSVGCDKANEIDKIDHQNEKRAMEKLQSVSDEEIEIVITRQRRNSASSVRPVRLRMVQPDILENLEKSSLFLPEEIELTVLTIGGRNYAAFVCKAGQQIKAGTRYSYCNNNDSASQCGASPLLQYQFVKYMPSVSNRKEHNVVRLSDQNGLHLIVLRTIDENETLLTIDWSKATEQRAAELLPPTLPSLHLTKAHLTLGEEEEKQREKEQHSDDSKGYQCNRCDKVFTYKYYRDKHLKYTRCVDMGDRKYPCQLCSRSFEKRDRLRIHVLHVHEKYRPHVCTVCGKQFSQSSSLNKHQRVHSGERPYKCTYCTKAFTASSILRTHIRQHSGEKPFKCKFCGKAFASHAAHDSHVRRTHDSTKQFGSGDVGTMSALSF